MTSTIGYLKQIILGVCLEKRSFLFGCHRGRISLLQGVNKV